MTQKTDEERRELQVQLKITEENFEREMRARGFDPAQAETSALPTALANLYLKRRSLLEALSELEGNISDE